MTGLVSTKNIGIFEIIMFEILTSCLLTTSLVLNNSLCGSLAVLSIYTFSLPYSFTIGVGRF